MSNPVYSDEMYHDAMVVVVGDIIYSDASCDSKIGRIRKLTEYIVRRLTKYNPNSNLELGDDRTIAALKRAGVTEQFFWDAYKVIRNNGNDANHSKVTVLPDEADLERVKKASLITFCYLFFDYFKKYPFGSSPQVMRSFSLLPPFMRLTVLLELLRADPSNIFVIDKLMLVLVKTLGMDDALRLVESEKEFLTAHQMQYSSDDMKMKILIYGMENMTTVMKEMQETIYDYLVREIPKVRILGEINLPYTTFETAKKYYLENGIIEGNTPEITEFNSLMKFRYTGIRIANE